MPDLDELLTAVGAATAAADDAAAEVTQRAREVRRLAAQRERALRSADPRDPQAEQRLAALAQRVAAAEEDLATAHGAAKRAAAARAAAVVAAAREADPREQIARLSDGTPLLLMPLRLETRFKDDELWLRVFPDDWAVDTFEPHLSEVEVESAVRYWRAYWRAGGNDAMRRAAWAGLVASHGSGRANWILDHHQPVVPGAEPVRTAADEVVLVVAGEEPAADAGAAADYWEAVWRAGDDAAAVAAARAALVADTDPARAEAVVEAAPFNFGERPPRGTSRATVALQVGFLQVPRAADLETRGASWTQPPRARVLPDRFVVMGYADGDLVLDADCEPIPTDLAVGPDPSAAPADQMRIEDGRLVLPDELRWMVDFERAIEAGMGLRVPLDDRTRGGFDRLVVIGIKVTKDPAASQAELEALVRRHAASRSGISLVPQGTPTNNTQDGPSGLDRTDDPDASYDRRFGAAAALEHRTDWRLKQDGQWLAEALGIDPAVLADVPGAAGTDQAEARAMNEALWPATWGYFLDTMLAPVLSDDTIEAVREFFAGYVSGRGAVPAIRIGRQPYGVLPTTVFSRLSFPVGRGGAHTHGAIHVAAAQPRASFLDQLHAVLRRIHDDWRQPVDGAAHVGAKSTNPHQTLLDIVALHPASVEFHQRYAQSLEDLWNRLSFYGISAQFLEVLEALGLYVRGRQLLAGFGHEEPDPEILRRIFHGAQQQLGRQLVDDRPVSEDEGLRDQTTDARNYLEWLADASFASLDTLRGQQGFQDGRPPRTLLYLMLRHALMLSWWDTGVRLRAEAGSISGDELRAARAEPAFVHIADDDGSESRWAGLYRVDDAVDPVARLVDVIPTVIDTPPALRLNQVSQAIRRLEDVPTARLERALVEHLDCCSYRLDAWRLGLVHHRLLGMRLGDGDDPAVRGVHVGAYGWLEDVRPRSPLRPVTRRGEAPTVDPLLRDPGSGGYVHAPSLNHAGTAAVLRSGYLANATPEEPDVMSVNLSSERVRIALGVIEGIRNGQPLGALLGYRLERGLHDRHAEAEVDEFIHPLRRAFPLQGDRFGSQVVDGLELIKHVDGPAPSAYPFGRTDLPPASTAQAAVIDSEVERLRDVHDALGDLALAEGVHQAVLGNPDRVAATLDAYGRSSFPPEPAVVETPRSGISVAHRIGLHLRPGLSHTTSPLSGVPMTPRAMSEPAVNEFVGALLPPPAQVGVRVRWTGASGTGARVVTQQDLALQPLDLVHWLRLEDHGALAALDERILQQVTAAESLRPDAELEIRYTEALPAPMRSLFEIAPLVEHVRAVVQTSRPLRPSDVISGADAKEALDGALTTNAARPAAVRTALLALRADLTTFESQLGALLADRVANRATLLADVDTFADRLVGLLGRAALFGLPGSGWSEIAGRRAAVLAAVATGVAGVVERWELRSADAGAQLDADDALPVHAAPGERIAYLMLAERTLRRAVTDPLPADPDVYRGQIETRLAAFNLRIDGIRGLAAAATTVAGTLAGAATALPAAERDDHGLDLTPLQDDVIALCDAMLARATAVGAEADRRAAAAQGHLTAHDAAAGADARVEAVLAATQALLGEAVVVVPEFTLPPELGDEWEAALSWSRSGGLMAHLSARAFPVDDWMHGVARVREKVAHWEQVVLLGGTVGQLEPGLRPVQLPHAAEPWLAMELPAGHRIAGERLLYAAHLPGPFVKTDPQCGLLVDEWNEVIPGDTETTGIAVHFNRPDAEPPHAMLLVTPPVLRGSWQWDDVVDALHETLELASLRAVEPAALDDTAYAAFLPATVSAANVSPVSLALNLSLVNGLVDHIGGRDA